MNLREKRIKIGNLIMEVVQGDITEEKTDVIVNSTDDFFNLSGGSEHVSIFALLSDTFVRSC